MTYFNQLKIVLLWGILVCKWKFWKKLEIDNRKRSNLNPPVTGLARELYFGDPQVLNPETPISDWIGILYRNMKSGIAPEIPNPLSHFSFYFNLFFLEALLLKCRKSPLDMELCMSL